MGSLISVSPLQPSGLPSSHCTKRTPKPSRTPPTCSSLTGCFAAGCAVDCAGRSCLDVSHAILKAQRAWFCAAYKAPRGTAQKSQVPSTCLVPVHLRREETTNVTVCKWRATNNMLTRHWCCEPPRQPCLLDGGQAEARGSHYEASDLNTPPRQCGRYPHTDKASRGVWRWAFRSQCVLQWYIPMVKPSLAVLAELTLHDCS